MSDSKRKNADSLESASSLAGAEGLEPSTKVLETHVLPLHHAPTNTHYYTGIRAKSQAEFLLLRQSRGGRGSRRIGSS